MLELYTLFLLPLLLCSRTARYRLCLHPSLTQFRGSLPLLLLRLLLLGLRLLRLIDNA